jgi:hypothetical protein
MIMVFFIAQSVNGVCHVDLFAHCASKFFITETKYLRKYLREEQLLWLMISVYGYLVPSLWAWDEIKHHGYGDLPQIPVTIRWSNGGWEDGRKEPGKRWIFPGHTPSDPLPQTTPTFHSSTPPKIVYSNFESIIGLVHWRRPSPHHFPKAPHPNTTSTRDGDTP